MSAVRALFEPTFSSLIVFAVHALVSVAHALVLGGSDHGVAIIILTAGVTPRFGCWIVTTNGGFAVIGRGKVDSSPGSMEKGASGGADMGTLFQLGEVERACEDCSSLLGSCEKYTNGGRVVGRGVQCRETQQ